MSKITVKELVEFGRFPYTKGKLTTKASKNRSGITGTPRVVVRNKEINRD